MKKIMVLALAVVMTAAFVMPASALENKFGGYWRTRAFTMQNFTGEDQSEKWDYSLVDTRTRLFYTAVINENLQFVNKFEFNSVWGDVNGGDIGADGEGNWRIKNSYVDFTLAPVNFKVGIQATKLARGFMFDDDFSGAIITYKGEGFSLPLIWIKAFEGGKGVDTDGDTANDSDFDYYALAPSITLSEMLTVTPYAVWATSDKASGWKVGTTPATLHTPLNTTATADKSLALSDFEEINLWYVGLDLDVKFDGGKAWFTGVYQGGSMDYLDSKKESMDVSAWLAAIGASVNLSDQADIHGQFFYASGDEDINRRNPKADNDMNAFFLPSQHDSAGQSYYWAEIMGYGIFDLYGSANAPQDHISNIMAGNIGTTIKPMPDFSVTLDVWYAKLAEGIKEYDSTGKVTSDEDYLGTEIDLVMTYTLMKGLNLDVVGAYLLRGDATYKGDNDANPYEVGTRLSLSF